MQSVNLVDFLISKKIFPSYVDENNLRKEDDIWYNCTTLLDYNKITYYIETADFNYKKIDTTLGRYLTKFYKLSPAAITHICEKVKSIIKTPGNFKIVSGEDISKCYFYKNYVPSHGTLNNSCMRYKKCQDFNFFKVYEDVAEMLVMTPKRGKRVLGRAILWKYNNTYVMDRVYSTENYIENQFYEYAKSKGWYILANNTYVTCNLFTQLEQNWLSPEDNYEEPITLDLKVSLKDDYRWYPFIDSVCYYNSKEKCIQTQPFIDESGIITVLHTTGGNKSYIRHYEER